nr:MAG TPA: hypothetical protein [Caudoviricetes sp.]
MRMFANSLYGRRGSRARKSRNGQQSPVCVG